MSEKINFTPDQMLAINTEGRDILVSAAAGSGKTAVLTKRVLNRIVSSSQKADITDFLVVTFTVSAAADLKKKLSEGIRDEMKCDGADVSRLRRQLLSLSYAKIATIDSFCRFIVKDCSQDLGLPSGMNLADEDEIKAIAKEIMDETVEKYYAESGEDSDFLLLAETFSDARGDAKLVPSLLSVYDRIMQYPVPMSLLSENLADLKSILSLRGKESVFSTSLLSPLMDEIKEKLFLASKFFDEAKKLCELDEDAWNKYLPVIEKDEEFVKSLKEALDVSYDEFNRILQLNIHDKMPQIRGRSTDEVLERIKSMRKSGRDIISSLINKFGVESEEEIFSQLETHIKVLEAINKVICDFHETFTEEKKKQRIMNFSDMSHYAFSALVVEESYDRKNGTFEKTPYAKALTESFSQILIDEYQDVNELQDLIFRAVSNSKNRFMVGDIKQSIYAFRGATPEIFEHYRDVFLPITSSDDKSDAPGTVFLQNNYRSDSSIIDFTNAVFSKLMNHDEKKYLEKDELVFSKKEDAHNPVELVFFEEEKSDERDSEAEYVADEIIKLTSSGECKYSDIAILARNRAMLEKMKEVFDKKKIPCENTDKSGFFESYEILSLISFLRAVSNPTDDLALATAMTTLPFAFSPDELFEIRKYDKKRGYYFALVKASHEEGELGEKCRDFLEFIVSMQEWSQNNSCDSTVWKIIEKTEFFRQINALSNSAERRENVILFYELSRKFSRGEMKSIGAFCDYIENFEKSGSKKSGHKKFPDAVNLLTFHSSKGLQFPVVFAVGLGDYINKLDGRNKIIFSQFGPFFDLPHLNPCTQIISYLRKSASASVEKSSVDEELRILYVAFTRAEKRLYITAKTKTASLKKTVFNASICKELFSHTVKNAVTYISFLASALHENPTFLKAISNDAEYVRESSPTLCVSVIKNGFKSELSVTEKEKNDELHLNLSDEEILFAMRELPEKKIYSVPFKISVSDLKDGTSEYGGEEKSVEFVCAPQFINPQNEESFAFEGTSMHTFMQFCSFDLSGEEDCRREGKRLAEEGFILPEHEKCLDYKKLARFFDSNLFKQIKASKRVEREKRYTLKIGADKLFRDINADDSESVLMQGVIDCFFENEDGTVTLVDFKTDRVKRDGGREILIKRHSRQLCLYAETLSQILHKEVSKIYIYSFALDSEVEIVGY